MIVYARRTLLGVLLLSFLALTACGYTLVRDKGIFNGEITALSVPMFKNETFEAHSPGYFTEAFSRELAASGHFQVNKSPSDATLKGTVSKVTVSLYTFGGTGVAVEKTVNVQISLALLKDGNQVKTWTFADTEPYQVSDINQEDFNRRQAIQTIAGRMARRFHAQLLSDY